MGTPRFGLSPRESTPSSDRGSPSATATQKRQVTAVQARVIEAMYESLRTLDDREVLSVKPDADPLDVRCAYESLLAAFHPRRFERTAPGEHREKLEAIRRRIHEAYLALSTEADRAAHDARFGKPDY